jgi:hypothetical protein
MVSDSVFVKLLSKTAHLSLPKNDFILLHPVWAHSVYANNFIF